MTNEEYEAKKLLAELQSIDKFIQSNVRELEKLRMLSTSIGGSDFKERFKNEGYVENRLENQIAEIVDLENDIRKELNKYTRLRKLLRKAIGLQKDKNERLLLTLRYIENMTWEEISEKMDCSVRWVYKLHKIALKNFKLCKLHK